MQNTNTIVAMALYKETGPVFHQPLTQANASVHSASMHQAIWVEQGIVEANNKSYFANDGFYEPVGLNHPVTINSQTHTDTILLRFICITGPSSTVFEQLLLQENSSTQERKLIASKTFQTNLNNTIFRLDRVDFPPGAVAYRHTHPGSGFRYLTCGSLQLHTDHGVQNMSSGDAWFEPDNSPVKAVADTVTDSQFIRVMLLPSEFENRSSFTLQNQVDADKPRLQTTHRYFDQSITLTRD